MSPASVEVWVTGDGWLTLASTRVGVGGLQDRLLLVPGALTKHAVEPKPDEQRNQRENDDNGQSKGPAMSWPAT